ncbi:MAG TPA: hypothetical protein VH518_16730 [Tepidisphaeraceae bacterium]|jgi:predicted nucleotidyltransferase
MTEHAPNESVSHLGFVVAILRRHGVEFIVIGGQAEALMGSPRVTYDTDLCYRRSQRNLERLAAALKELEPSLRGAPADLPIILDARALALGSNYTFDTPHGKLDLLAWVEPIGHYEEVAKHAEVYSFDGGDLLTISLDDLIRVKEHIRRTKDRGSLIQLLAIKKQREETGRR